MIDYNLFKIYWFDQRMLSWWCFRRDKIDFDLIYQCKGWRWLISDKQYFVDLIINGFDVLKFYFVDFIYSILKLNEKKKFYVVIDGKQRLEVIFDFFDD